MPILHRDRRNNVNKHSVMYTDGNVCRVIIVSVGIMSYNVKSFISDSDTTKFTALTKRSINTIPNLTSKKPLTYVITARQRSCGKSSVFSRVCLSIQRGIPI